MTQSAKTRIPTVRIYLSIIRCSFRFISAAELLHYALRRQRRHLSSAAEPQQFALCRQRRHLSSAAELLHYALRRQRRQPIGFRELSRVFLSKLNVPDARIVSSFCAGCNRRGLEGANNAQQV